MIYPPEIELNNNICKSLSDHLIYGQSNDIPSIICSHLYRHGFVIVRNIKSDTLLDELIKKIGFTTYTDTLGRNKIKLVANPFQKTSAETLLEGKFHTDFSSMPNPPDLISLYCNKSDCRHPFYGRNQIISLAILLRAIKSTSVPLFNIFTRDRIPYLMRGNIFWNNVLHRGGDGNPFIKYHPGYISKKDLLIGHYIKGELFSDLIEEIALSNAYDFCLDDGDAVLVSNKRCLHRRGRATIAFGPDLQPLNGRHVTTRRYLSPTKNLNLYPPSSN